MGLLGELAEGGKAGELVSLLYGERLGRGGINMGGSGGLGDVWRRTCFTSCWRTVGQDSVCFAGWGSVRNWRKDE